MLKKIARWLLKDEISEERKSADRLIQHYKNHARDVSDAFNAQQRLLNEERRLRREEQKAYGNTIGLVRDGTLLKAINAEINGSNHE